MLYRACRLRLRCKGAQVKVKHIRPLLAHAQIGQPQLAVLLTQAHKAVGKAQHALHMRVIAVRNQ